MDDIDVELQNLPNLRKVLSAPEYAPYVPKAELRALIGLLQGLKRENVRLQVENVQLRNRVELLDGDLRELGINIHGEPAQT